MGTHKMEYTEDIRARITPKEKLVLHSLARKHGGLSAAVRYLIHSYAAQRTNDKPAVTSQGAGGLVTSSN